MWGLIEDTVMPQPVVIGPASYTTPASFPGGEYRIANWVELELTFHLDDLHAARGLHHLLECSAETNPVSLKLLVPELKSSRLEISPNSSVLLLNTSQGLFEFVPVHRTFHFRAVS